VDALEDGAGAGAGVAAAQVATPSMRMLSWLSSSGSKSTKKQHSMIARLARAMLRGGDDPDEPSAGTAALAAGGWPSSLSPGDTAIAAGPTDRSDSRLADEEWVLALLDAALDQLRPEFALSVPVVNGRLLLATTNRLLLREPDNLLQSRQPMVVASHLQVDCDSCSDSWSGESFLRQRSPRAIRSWAGRHWQPWGVKLHLPDRWVQAAAVHSSLC
jgi:hypothetical protein